MRKKFLITTLINLFILIANTGWCLTTLDKVHLESTSKAAKILEKEFGLHCCGSSCETDKCIKLLSLSFQVNRELYLDDARNLIVPIVSRFISILNEDSFLKPHMVKYPFDHLNVEVTVYFMTKRNRDVFHPKICVAALQNGKFKFCTIEDIGPSPYKSVYYESYSETLEKVGQHKLPPPM